jgi:hypothetical protein
MKINDSMRNHNLSRPTVLMRLILNAESVNGKQSKTKEVT